MKLKKKTIYRKPQIASKKVILSRFYTVERIFDSFDQLLVPNAFANSHSGGGCSSGSSLGCGCCSGMCN